jgi:hypothetical protein
VVIADCTAALLNALQLPRVDKLLFGWLTHVSAHNLTTSARDSHSVISKRFVGDFSSGANCYYNFSSLFLSLHMKRLWQNLPAHKQMLDVHTIAQIADEAVVGFVDSLLSTGGFRCALLPLWA